MINVIKPYLPPFEEYRQYLEGVWGRGWLTNHGPLVAELENQLKEYLVVKHICYVASGTVALQIAIKALDLRGEVITTAFSHVSTVNAILWEKCKPVFVDIEKSTFCIDVSKIEAAITGETCAILATHIYGYPCNVTKIQGIADKYGLKVIYDGAQSFGVKVNGQSIFSYGDISVVSFHATKVFHTIEGGAVFANDEVLFKKCLSLSSFGLQDAMPCYAGINGKNSEFHAAMGLCNLSKVIDIVNKRKDIYFLYREAFRRLPVQFQEIVRAVNYNYAYFPLIFSSESRMLSVKNVLSENGIHVKRYFYPSLNKLPYYSEAHCPVSEDIASRVLCLPLYYDLSMEDASRIAELIVQSYDQDQERFVDELTS